MIPGAHLDETGTRFVVFSTRTRDVRVRVSGGDRVDEHPLEDRGDGFFAVHVPGVQAGALYTFVLDGELTPDPYARELPNGVHREARVVEKRVVPPLASAPPAHRWVIYELHVGTFTSEGTYRAAMGKLDHLVSLGITAIELLPLAAFDGSRGWGYDGVALFAPYAPYGTPDDLRAFVVAAHERGLAVILDVVYNHFGPAGNYLARYSPRYFTDAVSTPWGPAPDFAHAPMRRLVLENVRMWLEEYGFDGLRLDATHAIHDLPEPGEGRHEHVLATITRLAHDMTPRRRIFFEDDRNDPTMVSERNADAIWTDDLHHQIHVLLTRERDGYYAAYEPTLEALAHTIRRGYTYEGQEYAPWKKSRGKPNTLPPSALVVALQNHDQTGNRAFGTRIHHEAALDACKAAAMLVLFLPTTPLLFMGEEWAASTPFLFFSDHDGDLGKAISKGRREEMKAFAAFADAKSEIPDPQAEATFERSKLKWEELVEEPHASVLTLYRALLALRRDDPVLSEGATFEDLDVKVHGDVLDVVRGARRRLLVNFGEVPAAVPPHERTPFERTLLATTPFDGKTLAPKQAVIFAE